jgi:hypothetical protein
LLKTGWKRKNRNDKDGLRLHEVEHGKRDAVGTPVAKVQTMTVTQIAKAAVATAKLTEGEVPLMNQEKDDN